MICLQEGRHLVFAPLETLLAGVAERFFRAALRNLSSPIIDDRFFLP
jgi:hypothetical protein